MLDMVRHRYAGRISGQPGGVHIQGGGQGLRYTCRVPRHEQVQELYLYHDGDFWFVEKEQLEGVLGG